MRSSCQTLLIGMCCLLAGVVCAQDENFSCRSAGAKLNAGPAILATTLAGVPALLRVPQKITRSPIVLWHGFGPPDSERDLMAALPLDDVPAVKVYLGLPMFGARAGSADELVRRQREEMATLVFEPVVMGAAKELPAVLQALERHDCIARGEAIGLFGFSAGGAAVLYALAEADVPIIAAVTLNASTGLTASIAAYERASKRSYAWTEAARKLARDSDAVSRAKDIAAGDSPRALQIIHGADDAMLTPQIAVSLHDALLPWYSEANAEQRLQLTVASGLAHGWARAGTVEALRSSIAAWFQAHLSAVGAPPA